VTGIFLGLAVVLGAGAGWAGVAGCAGLVATALLARGRQLVWTVALVPAALFGCIRVGSPEQLTTPSWSPDEVVYVGSVESGPIENGRVQRFELWTRPESMESRIATEVKLCARAPLIPTIGFQDRLRISGHIRWLDEVDDQTAGYLRSQQCAGTIEIERATVLEKGDGVRATLDRGRCELASVLQSAVPGDSGALLTGLVTGDDDGLPADRRDDFIVTGTSHVTAVSGSNLAVIVTIFALTGGAIGFAKRSSWQIALIVALWLYVGMVGLSPPPLRAAAVATLAIGAQKLGRRPDFVTLSLFVAAIELLVRPADFDSLAYRLSTISAVALVLGLAGRTPEGWRGKLTHGIVATAVTQAATSALLVPTFGRVSLYAIPANLIIGPLCTIAFPLALMASITGLVSRPLADAIAIPASLPAKLALDVVSFFARLPGANAGSGVAGTVSPRAWILIGILSVVLLSKECRGGFRRLMVAISALDARSRVVAVGSASGAVLGTVAGLWLR
jgi:ComEC/Rec2-related protein